MKLQPRPATVDIKLDTVGERAVEQLFWRMANPDDPSRAKIIIPSELVPAEDVAEQQSSTGIPVCGCVSMRVCE